MKRPMKRHDFLSSGDELNYLNDVVRYLAAQGDVEKVAPCLNRMHELLRPMGTDDGSIMLQDHWAVLHEIRGDFVQAVPHRQREVELIEKLFEIDGPIAPVDFGFLIQTMDALANDYLQFGEVDKEQELRQKIQILQTEQLAKAASDGLPPTTDHSDACSAGKSRTAASEVARTSSADCRQRNPPRSMDRR